MTPGEIPVPETLPSVIAVRGARHNNPRDIDVDVPLWRTVAVVGVSGSGKTSLAMGTLYAEGLQQFLEALSTYSRRRLTQAQRPDVDRIEHLPPALALRQRPPVPGPRSTVGTMSEVLNVLRLMMSRLGAHRCPNSHMVQPSIAVEQEEIVCPVCGARFEHPGAESFAFNSYGACPACQGLGVRSEVDESTLVPDPDQTIEDGAVLPWNSGGRRLSMYAAGELGVRLDVPYKDLTDREKDIVLDEPSVGLHPSNVTGLLKTITALAGNGNSVVVVEHEREVIRAADWIIELGPGAGGTGGTIIAQAPPPSWSPIRARSSARSWPAPPPCHATNRRRPRRKGRSPSRSAICTTCTTSPLSSRWAGSPRWPALRGPGRPPSSWTASFRLRGPG
jgi:excinuclease UvrABC ATPase subunit